MLIFCPAFAPKGDAIKLAMTIIIAGMNSTWPVVIFANVDPIEEINVIANEEAIVIFVGIFRTESIIGTNRKAPAAPTIPDPIPIKNESEAASHLLKFTMSNGISSIPLFGTNIIKTANAAKMPYTRLMLPSLIILETYPPMKLPIKILHPI